jgi:hypothetical protein
VTEYDFGSCGVRMVRTGVVQLGETRRKTSHPEISSSPLRWKPIRNGETWNSSTNNVSQSSPISLSKKNNQPNSHNSLLRASTRPRRAFDRGRLFAFEEEKKDPEAAKKIQMCVLFDENIQKQGVVWLIG